MSDIKNKTGIYKITSPSGKIYIGQSTNCLIRKSRYKTKGAPNQPKLNSSFKKYGWEAHLFEIIHICPIEELNYWEIYYGKLFNVNSDNGLNVRECGGSKGATAESTKEKLRIVNTGKKLTEEHKVKIKISNIGKERSLETRNNMSNSRKGMKLTDEHKKNIGNGNRGKIISNITRQRVGDANADLILNIETGIFYMGLKNASESRGMNMATLHYRLKYGTKKYTPFIYA